ncbi:inositol hexakisphosphate and diphosphoinositol-pentakisphosphate kinase 2-like isoform X2 [Paramacrobiotus metropolitanus]|uniref:inositol hexakisphosphate and diphosphoinositol-pentakisphosphate kinase 2-like isoform X2 n=1 Tax=Paramacrobiotus metropolitanus TaxID=2943436 RepID=UPI0024462D14|nr:inositol hexakisphosphate and diphosphoinositol-pentakisphosphate kinase 2-like isoform X2 [Paramacrobiotus metropolitanus]
MSRTNSPTPVIAKDHIHLDLAVEDHSHSGSLSTSPVNSSSLLPSPQHTLRPSPLPSPHRRRSMTVPINIAALPLTASGGDSLSASQDISPGSSHKDIPPFPLPVVAQAPKKPKRFIVSKISEASLKDGGGLILPDRTSAGSSLAGSPEVGRARSPLVAGVAGEERVVSPSSMEGSLISLKPQAMPANARPGSLASGATERLSRGSSKDQAELPQSASSPSSGGQPDHEPYVTLGVCAMAKKAKSKYMTEILRRITQEFDQIKTLVFDEQQILHDPVEKWPVVDALICFQSERFPLDKAISYADLRKPFVVNDLKMQHVIKDRRKVYELLKSEGIDVPRYAVLDRESGNPDDAHIEEYDDYVVVNGVTFNKPFVEKPICADDHNVYIYYPMAAGGGSQRLFRKIGSRSSVYSSESKVRKTGSYIYEEFMPTDGTDVKVYTVGPEYAHAEARKSPALDGVVERDKEGKEIRFPVILNNIEKLIARRVCIAFKQTVCGFDLLRASGRSYVCDVNGFSFVKNSMIYYNDCAKIVANNILRRLAPQLHIQWAMPYQLGDPPIVTTTFGKEMELRSVVAVIRHGDRTPKQKMKMEIRHPVFFEVFEKFGGKFETDGREIKLKKPNQLQEILDIVRNLLANRADEPEVRDKRLKLEQLKAVLEMYGHFSGINRKIQIKYQLIDRTDSPCRSEAPVIIDPETSIPPGSLVLIMKWGGELTPLGKYQSEQLGQMFRCMYPGSGEFSRKKGHGLLRLHSTFRHDLKIYASDEGRVQTTAAAFAKGFLALEGELTPILVQMVKSADTNGLLDNDLDAREHENAVKKRLKAIMKQDRDFTDEDCEILNPTNSLAIKASMDVIKNPVKACEQMHESIKELNAFIREKAANLDSDVPTLYSGESWDLIQRRWGKLEKDFRLKDGSFDITKIPDIYDCIKFDIHHNQWISRSANAKQLFSLGRNLANIVVPLEYGITAKEKLAIAQGVATPLLKKIRADLQRVIDYQDDPENINRLHPRFSQNVASPGRLVRSRLYFTSESHIHSLMNMLRFGGLIGGNDEQWSRAMKYISTVSEFNFLTQIVIMMYEDPNKELRSEERFHIEIHFSPGMMLRNEDVEDTEGPGFRTVGSVGKVSKSASNESIDFLVTKASTTTLKNEPNDLPSLPKKINSSFATSMSHLADGWLDNLDSNSTINFPKTRYDRSTFTKISDSGVIMNRVFSTAVIKGVSSASSLDKVDDKTDKKDGDQCLHVPNVHSLETLHNALHFHELDMFLQTVTESSSKQTSAVTSPIHTPDQHPLLSSLSHEQDDTSHNRFWTHQESFNADVLNQENQFSAMNSLASSAVTSPYMNGPVGFFTTAIGHSDNVLTTKHNNISESNPDHLKAGDNAGDRSFNSSSPRIDSLVMSPIKEANQGMGAGPGGGCDEETALPPRKLSFSANP